VKLIIQIPCYNEGATLALTLAELPRNVQGFEQVEWLIVDDGSSDNTVEEARKHGVDHIIRHSKNKGLAAAFMTGLNACLALKADVIVNTDADNQYSASNIPDLVKPILERSADMVIGERPISSIKHFSPAKKLLQKIGSWVVRVASQTNVPDAPSGFRAISKEAAQQLMVFNNFTYTLETIIQAGQKGLAVTSVPVNVNEELRPSRLVKNSYSYIKQSCFTIIRIFIIYKPFYFFSLISSFLFFTGFLICFRFLYYFSIGAGGGHIQSLILGSLLIGMGFQAILIAFIADLLSANRKLLEDVRYLLRKKISTCEQKLREENINQDNKYGSID
jgi:glycosyltransferase involved in cell wall biosynthesis